MNKDSNKSILMIITALFFMWGFLTCMNDILIPYLKDLFDLKYWQAMLVQFAFFGAYFIGSLIYFLLSLKFGDPINKIGYQNGIVIGLVISSVGCFLFYPAAQYAMYGFFLSALFILGLGFTMLQIAANPYVSILGPAETASSRLNMSQAFNSLGTTIAPILGGYLIFDLFFSEAMSGDAVKVPYLVFGALFLLMAIVFKLIKLPNFVNDSEIVKGIGALKFPNLSLGTIAIFTYVGGEVAIGSFLINFIGLENIMGLEEATAKNFLAYYWGGAMIGRFSGAISLSDMPQSKKYLYMVLASSLSFGLIFAIADVSFETVIPYLFIIGINFVAFILGKSVAGRTLGIFASVSVILILVAMFTNGNIAMWALIGVGIFNSIMWPNIFTLAIKGLGKYTGQASSLLVMAILGGALIPLVQGYLADIIGVQMSFIIPVVCYLYILFYGFYNSRKEEETSEEEQEEQAVGMMH
ncbi:sugar MFS transporter [Sediminitomix flava]|uniref:FHS family L-fucose permease-like MFS transporter n=1 Tax=Sediminitomix flava TaxID=379075 RepID=A0A315ZAN8_SEDFL|nr:sugar MFS transporter [Sediminitomix flava]PWJ42611.1 FHS family L-fucose permease-like MFS transporter [Sediminitomix flava]